MNRRRLAFLAVAAVFLLLFGGRWVALRYTEHLWFDTLGQGDRWRWLFLRGLMWQALVFVAALAWFGAHSLGVYASIGSVHLPRRLGNLEIDEAVAPRTLRAIAVGIAALLALATTYSFADLDHYVALARIAVPVGLSEPVLHKDAAFYLAVLPLLEVLHLLASVCAMLAAVLVISLYALTGSLAVSRRRVRVTPHARSHLVVLLCALALVVAWGFYLDALQLVGGSGHAGGALSPTDRSIRIPASNALTMIALAVAAGSALALRWVKPALLFILWATLGVAALLGRFAVPWMAEAWGAADPALVQGVEQLAENFSRASYGLIDLHRRPLATVPLRAESTAALGDAVDGLYGWTGEQAIAERLLSQAMPDSGARRRWNVSPVEMRDASGRVVPAAIAVSQLDLTEALRQVPRPRWTPLHREAMAWGGGPVAFDGSARAGAPRFYASLNATDTAAPGTPLIRGRVRFLPYHANLGVVSPDQNTPGEPAPGVLLEGMVRRLFLAWALQSPPLLDGHTSPADRVLFWRDMPQRLSRLYPFAAFDPVRAVVVGGRLLWMTDGYVVSDRFPLAEEIRWHGERLNFVQAAYVVTVDASSGDTRFYLRPAASAFAASVARAESLFPLPADSMPLELRRALRYPASLLSAQAAAIALRSERDGRGPAWQPAWPDTTEEGMDAGLLMPALAFIALEEGARRPWQFLPVSDVRADRLAALVAGTVRGDGRLSLSLLTLEAGTPSVRSAETRIGAAPALVAAAAGLDGAPRRGPVLVLPAAGTVVFAQALYSTGPRGAGPVHPGGVALLADGRVGFGTDPRTAARAVVRGDTQSIVPVLSGANLAEARAAFLALDSAGRAGDWERFGRAMAQLRRALQIEVPPAGTRP